MNLNKHEITPRFPDQSLFCFVYDAMLSILRCWLLFLFPSVCLSPRLSLSLFVCVSLSVCPSLFQSVCLSLPVSLLVTVSVCVSLSIRLSLSKHFHRHHLVFKTFIITLLIRTFEVCNAFVACNWRLKTKESFSSYVNKRKFNQSGGGGWRAEGGGRLLCISWSFLLKKTRGSCGCFFPSAWISG